MYPAGKDAISQHLATSGLPHCDHTVTLKAPYQQVLENCGCKKALQKGKYALENGGHVYNLQY